MKRGTGIGIIVLVWILAWPGFCQTPQQGDIANEISLRPAVPAGWDDGSVIGLRARGGFEVDMQWQQGRLQAAQIHSQKTGPCTLRYGAKTATVMIKAGETVSLNAQLSVATEAMPGVQKRDFQFDGTISRDVLENYLDRSVTMAFFLVTGLAERGREPYSFREDDLRMIQNIGAKFIGRAIYRWGGESRLKEPGFWSGAKGLIERVHAYDWIKQTDVNGHLQMPVSRMISCPNETRGSYRANTRCPACPIGYSQEETIKKIWSRTPQQWTPDQVEGTLKKKPSDTEQLGFSILEGRTILLEGPQDNRVCILDKEPVA